MEGYIKLFKEYLAVSGKKYSKNAEKLLDLIFSIHAHFTFEQIKEKIKFNLKKNDLEEILDNIVSAGLIRKIFFQNKIYYEQIYGHAHHDHLICVKCSKIVPFKDEIIEKEQKRIVDENGFEFLKHSLLITGICPDCMKKDKKINKYKMQKEDKGLDKQKIIPLSMINSGEKVKIIKIEGGGHFAHRLISMGVSIGDTLEVVSNNFHGPFLVKVKNTRLGLGYGMTHKIFVKRS